MPPITRETLERLFPDMFRARPRYPWSEEAIDAARRACGCLECRRGLERVADLGGKQPPRRVTYSIPNPLAFERPGFPFLDPPYGWGASIFRPSRVAWDIYRDMIASLAVDTVLKKRAERDRLALYQAMTERTVYRVIPYSEASLSALRTRPIGVVKDGPAMGTVAKIDPDGSVWVETGKQERKPMVIKVENKIQARVTEVDSRRPCYGGTVVHKVTLCRHDGGDDIKLQVTEEEAKNYTRLAAAGNSITITISAERAETKLEHVERLERDVGSVAALQQAKDFLR